MQLCKNRPEGFFSSSPLTGLATQCFFDVVLVPLPTWILILLVLLLYLLAVAVPATVYHSLHRRQYKRRWHRILNLTLYYFFIVVVMLMESVEVARLVQIDFGVGLIPFVYFGCLLAAALQGTKGFWGSLRGWEVANALFWLISFAVAIAKLVALNKLPQEEKFRRETGPYGVSHQINDLAIMVAFYVLLFVMEVGLMFWKPWGEAARIQAEEQVELKA